MKKRMKIILIILAIIVLSIPAILFIFGGNKYNKGTYIYYDPVKDSSCNKASYYTTYNRNTTCYRWVVIDSGHKYRLMLDHNYVFDNNKEYIKYNDINSSLINISKKRKNKKIDLLTLDDAIDFIDLDKKQVKNDLNNGEMIESNLGKLLAINSFSYDEKNNKTIDNRGNWLSFSSKDNYSYIVNGDGKLEKVNKNTKNVGIRPIIELSKKKMLSEALLDIGHFNESCFNKRKAMTATPDLILTGDVLEGYFNQSIQRDLIADSGNASDLRLYYSSTPAGFTTPLDNNSSKGILNTNYGAETFFMKNDEFKIYFAPRTGSYAPSIESPRVITLKKSSSGWDDGTISSGINCGHGNDIAYNPNSSSNNKIIAATSIQDPETDNRIYSLRSGSSWKAACENQKPLNVHQNDSSHLNNIAVVEDRYIIPEGKTSDTCEETGASYVSDYCSEFITSNTNKLKIGKMNGTPFNKVTDLVNVGTIYPNGFDEKVVSKQTIAYKDGYAYIVYSDYTEPHRVGMIHIINVKQRKNGTPSVSSSYGKSVILLYADFLDSSLQPENSTRTKMEMEKVAFPHYTSGTTPTEESDTIFMLFNARREKVEGYEDDYDGVYNRKPYIYRMHLKSVKGTNNLYYYSTIVNYYDNSTSSTPDDTENYYANDQIDLDYYDTASNDSYLGWIYSSSGGGNDIPETFKNKTENITTSYATSGLATTVDLKSVKLSSTTYTDITETTPTIVNETDIQSFLSKLNCTRCTALVTENGTEKASGDFINGNTYKLIIKANDTSNTTILTKDIELSSIDSTYTITYDLNGGSVSDPNPVNYTKTTETFTLNNPTKEGYEFIGWTGSNGDTPQTTIQIEQGTIGNKSYIANYRIINYTITYDLDGGAATNPDTYTIEDEITLKIPTKNGYYFLGWTGSNSSIPETNVTISKGSTGNKTYKANYANQEDEDDKGDNPYSDDESNNIIKSARVYLTSYNKIALEWSKVSNADGYRVCYKNSKSLFYTCNYNASITGLKTTAGQKYLIRIAPYKLKNGQYILLSDHKSLSIYTLKKMNKPKVTKKSSKKVKIKIKKINGASGYEIYRSYKNKKNYKKIKTLKSNQSSFVIKATKNKKAYYKVRAYKTEKGKKINAPFSKVKKYTLR